MIEIHNPVMKMIEKNSLKKLHTISIVEIYKKQKDDVFSTFIFSLRRFDQKLPNRVILLKKG